MATSFPAALTIVFDGRCGMCTRTISWIIAHDEDRRMTPITCQSRMSVERFGISRMQCEASVWSVTPEGDLASGGQAAVLIAAVLWQRPWLVTLGRLPGVRHVLDIGYRLVARNRSRFPGMTPWCESHPDACIAEHDEPGQQ